MGENSVPNTSASLLARIKEPGNGQAWREFVALYRPLLVRFARSWGLEPAEADDVAQDCLAVLMRKMPDFEYDRRKGGFKRWLRAVASFQIRDHLRKRREVLANSGDFRREQRRERLPEEAWEQIWLQEHLKYCLSEVQSACEPKTFAAFQHFVLDEWPTDRVCEELGLNSNQVYIAKNRVGRKLREKMRELLGDCV